MSIVLLTAILYLVIVGALILLLRTRSDKDILFSSSLLTLCLGALMWLETKENVLFFFLSIFLLFDIGLAAFAPMLFKKTKKASPHSVEAQLHMSLTLWFLFALAAAGLWTIWGGAPALILRPVSKVFSQAVFLGLWSSYWPELMVVGLLMVSVSLGALLMVKVEREEGL